MIKQHLRIVFHLSKSFFLQEFRSRDSVFWILLFPVFMFVLFGTLFGEMDIHDGAITIGIDTELVSKSNSVGKFILQPMEESNKVNTVTIDREKGFEDLAANKLYAFISGPSKNGKLNVYITEKNRPYQACP